MKCSNEHVSLPRSSPRPSMVMVPSRQARPCLRACRASSSLRARGHSCRTRRGRSRASDFWLRARCSPRRTCRDASLPLGCPTTSLSITSGSQRSALSSTREAGRAMPRTGRSQSAKASTKSPTTSAARAAPRRAQRPRRRGVDPGSRDAAAARARKRFRRGWRPRRFINFDSTSPGLATHNTHE